MGNYHTSAPDQVNLCESTSPGLREVFRYCSSAQLASNKLLVFHFCFVCIFFCLFEWKVHTERKRQRSTERAPICWLSLHMSASYRAASGKIRARNWICSPSRMARREAPEPPLQLSKMSMNRSVECRAQHGPYTELYDMGCGCPKMLLSWAHLISAGQVLTKAGLFKVVFIFQCKYSVYGNSLFILPDF